jgi:hypothetical protein
LEGVPDLGCSFGVLTACNAYGIVPKFELKLIFNGGGLRSLASLPAGLFLVPWLLHLQTQVRI